MPSQKNTPARQKAQKKYNAKPEQKKNRAARNKARRTMIRQGRAKKGDGKDIDHKKPLAKGGSNSASNWRVSSKSSNRSFPRTSNAGMK